MNEKREKRVKVVQLVTVCPHCGKSVDWCFSKKMLKALLRKLHGDVKHRYDIMKKLQDIEKGGGKQ
jgi:hypothetical protein